MQKVNDDNGAWIYCFRREKSAVFLNRKDEVIKIFHTYDEAIEFAKNNIHLIDTSPDQQE